MKAERSYRLWSRAEDDRVRAGYASGEPLSGITQGLARLGFPRSPLAVEQRAQKVLKCGVPPREGWTHAQDEMLLALRREGFSFGEIAARLSEGPRPGTSRNACIGRMERVGAGRGSPARAKAEKSCRAKPSVRRAPVSVAASPAAPSTLSVPPAPAPVEGVERLPKRPRAPASLPPLPLPAETGEGGVPFSAAGVDACRYGLRGRGLDLVVCGALQAPGRPYCPAHVRLCYVPLTTREPRAPAEGGLARRPAREEREADLVDMLAGEAA